MKDFQLVVLAAGMGSRYGGLKQIDPVGPGGEVIIDYSVYDALRAGFRNIVFVIREEIKQSFREHVGLNVEQHADTTYVFQDLDDLPPEFNVPENREKPWGTAHALLCAQDAVDAPFAVINADDFYGAESYRILHDCLLEAFRSAGEDERYCLVGYPLHGTLSEHGDVSRGTCEITDDGFLTRIVERKKIRPFDDGVRYRVNEDEWVEIDPDTMVSMNMWGFTPDVFQLLQQHFDRFLENHLDEPGAEFLIPNVVNQLIQDNRISVRVCPTDETWFGVTYREDRERVERQIRTLVRDGVYPEKLWDAS